MTHFYFKPFCTRCRHWKLKLFGNLQTLHDSFQQYEKLENSNTFSAEKMYSVRVLYSHIVLRILSLIQQDKNDKIVYLQCCNIDFVRRGLKPKDNCLDLRLNWLKTAQNGSKSIGVTQSGSEFSKHNMSQIGSNLHKQAQNGTEWHKMAQNGTEWFKLAQNGSH